MKFYYKSTFWYSRAMLLLFFIPLFNFTFFSIAVTNFGFTRPGFLWGLALYMWVSSIISLLLAKLAERFFEKTNDVIKRFIIKYSLCAMLAWYSSFVILQWLELMKPPDIIQAKTPLLPLMIVLIEVLLFAALKFIFQQQQQQVVLRANYKEAQFRALKAQLNPHMLFNSLNLISSEIEHNPTNASLLVDELASLLRNVLRSSNSLLLPLYQEIELTKHYLVIQKMRFEDRLAYSLDIAPNCLNVHVPGLMLQPFIENCILHGFSTKKTTGKISVVIKQEDGFLLVKIQDNGVGFSVLTQKKGHGVRIVRDTLALIYGDKQSLVIKSNTKDGTLVTIKIPVEPSNMSYQIEPANEFSKYTDC